MSVLESEVIVLMVNLVAVFESDFFVTSCKPLFVCLVSADGAFEGFEYHYV